MEPNKVLNEEDRKKYTHPKKKQKVVDVNAFFGSTTPIPRLIDIRNGGISFEEPQPGPSRPRRSSSSSDSMDFNKRPSEDDDLASMVLEVEKAFIDAHNEIDPDHHSINLLIAGHINLAAWSSDHTVAFNTIMEINIPVMHLMARKSRNFLSLTENDQRLLLENNARLLQEYATSRYISSKSSMDQFLWITGPKESFNLGIVVFLIVHIVHIFLYLSTLKSTICIFDEKKKLKKEKSCTDRTPFILMNFFLVSKLS